jgi:hypothetical protein
MPPRRLAILVAAVFLLGACGQSGTYNLTWSFMTADGTPGDAASACGAHGVHAVLVTALTTDGTATSSEIARCTPGHFSHGIAPGTWHFKAQALNALDNPLDDMAAGLKPDAQPDQVDISDGGSADLMVVFIPLPECGDGVDNDGDGRVDIDDPDCGCATTGASEAGTAPWSSTMCQPASASQ